MARRMDWSRALQPFQAPNAFSQTIMPLPFIQADGVRPSGRDSSARSGAGHVTALEPFIAEDARKWAVPNHWAQLMMILHPLQRQSTLPLERHTGPHRIELDSEFRRPAIHGIEEHPVHLQRRDQLRQCSSPCALPEGVGVPRIVIRYRPASLPMELSTTRRRPFKPPGMSR